MKKRECVNWGIIGGGDVTARLIPADAQAVRDAYYAFSGDTHVDLWLMLGDNAYNNGTDPEYQERLFDIYPSMLRKSVLWPTLGNHDAASSDSPTQTGPYYEAFTLPTAGEAGGVASGTEAYYAFDHQDIHFIVLDSVETISANRGPMLSWLAEDLAAAEAALRSTRAAGDRGAGPAAPEDARLRLEIVRQERGFRITAIDLSPGPAPSCTCCG